MTRTTPTLMLEFGSRSHWHENTRELCTVWWARGREGAVSLVVRRRADRDRAELWFHHRERSNDSQHHSEHCDLLPEGRCYQEVSDSAGTHLWQLVRALPNVREGEGMGIEPERLIFRALKAQYDDTFPGWEDHEGLGQWTVRNVGREGVAGVGHRFLNGGAKMDGFGTARLLRIMADEVEREELAAAQQEAQHEALMAQAEAVRRGEQQPYARCGECRETFLLTAVSPTDRCPGCGADALVAEVPVERASDAAR